MLRTWLAAALSLFVLTACASADDTTSHEAEHLGEVGEALTAQCKANVVGHGMLDVETVYLPDVVHCENGGAPLESLKAQAIAARTYLYYKLETSGSIADGQGDQVYSCGSHAGALEKQAVAETAGMVLRYGTTTIAAFFVAGGNASPPACHDSSSSTSGDVTYNQGKSGNAIQQTPLGFVSPSNTRNRGCMSQLGSRCLAVEGKKADAILKFYYGDDIAITQATGPCVPTSAKPDAGTDGSSGSNGDGGAHGDGGAAPGDPSADGGGPTGAPRSETTTSASVEEQRSPDAAGCSISHSPRSPSAPVWLFAALAVAACVLVRRR